MALSATVEAAVRPKPQGAPLVTYNAKIQSDWVMVCNAPETVESDSGVVVGGKVVKPGAIVRSAQRYFRPQARATQIAVALKYDVGISVETSPVVRAFGRDANGLWHVLQGASASTEVTLTIALATDTITSDGLYKITTPKYFDLDGSDLVIIAIQTAFDCTGTKTNSEILVKDV